MDRVKTACDPVTETSKSEETVRAGRVVTRSAERPAKGRGRRPGAAKKGKLPEEEPEGGRMSLLSHLKELRRRLIICITFFLLGVTVCLSQAEWFTNLLLTRGSFFTFVYIAPAELMMTYVQVSIAGGVVVAVPVIIWQIWRFVHPGLRRRESVAFALVMTVGMALFVLGAVFAFAIVLPMLLAFFARLNSTGSVSAMVSVQEYVNYVVSTMLTFGIIFETPVAMAALTGTGLVKPKTLKKNFKYVVLIILIIAAVITPPDVTSQILISVPLMVLFYGSILLCQILFRRKLREAEEAEAQD